MFDLVYALRYNKAVTIKWNNEEIQYLKKRYGVGRKKELLIALPNCSWRSIQRKATQLELTRTFRFLRRKETIILGLSDFQIGYIAGFVDGEGTLQVRKHKSKNSIWYYPTILLTNTNYQVLDTLSKWLKAKVTPLRYTPSSKNHRDCFKITIATICDVLSLAKFLKPYLLIKRRQAELLEELAIIKVGKESQIIRGEHGRIKGTTMRTLPREEEIYEEVKKLNRRGR